MTKELSVQIDVIACPEGDFHLNLCDPVGYYLYRKGGFKSSTDAVLHAAEVIKRHPDVIYGKHITGVHEVL